jgi:hypothetical protein
MATFEEFAALALALPGAYEEITWGTRHTFRVRGKIFAMGAPEDEHVAVKAAKEDQAELLAADPETFSFAPYVGRFGWVQIALPKVGAAELGELVTDGWRRTAARAEVRAFDARSA